MFLHDVSGHARRLWGEEGTSLNPKGFGKAGSRRALCSNYMCMIYHCSRAGDISLSGASVRQY